jgi:hypothetical protein
VFIHLRVDVPDYFCEMNWADETETRWYA